jgi:hypothetical protein
MPAPTCYQALKFCALAGARLTATGAPDPGTESLYVSSSGITLGNTFVKKDGTVIQVENGCGNVCVDFEDCDRITRADLALQLCDWNYELMELFGAGVLETTGEDVSIGFALPDPNAACPDGVVIEAFAYAWDGEERAMHPVSGLPAYHRFRWPKVVWSLGNFTLGNTHIPAGLVGQAKSNSQIGLGPFGDWPSTPDGPFAVDLVDSLPTIECGYQVLDPVS